MELTDWNPLQSFDADRFDEVICEKVEPYLTALGVPLFNRLSERSGGSRAVRWNGRDVC